MKRVEEFYGDGRENLTLERLVKNSDWIWFTENQKLWGYNSKKDVREIVGDWIAKEIWVEEEVMDVHLQLLKRRRSKRKRVKHTRLSLQRQ